MNDNGALGGDQGGQLSIVRNGKYCSNCGKVIDAQAEICPNCGVRQTALVVSGGKSKIAAALLAIFLGSLGIHQFYLGHTSTGVVFLILWLVAWPLAFIGVGLLLFVILGIIAFVQGIMYLTMSDAAFSAKYDAVASAASDR